MQRVQQRFRSRSIYGSSSSICSWNRYGIKNSGICSGKAKQFLLHFHSGWRKRSGSSTSGRCFYHEMWFVLECDIYVATECKDPLYDGAWNQGLSVVLRFEIYVRNIDWGPFQISFGSQPFQVKEKYFLTLKIHHSITKSIYLIKGAHTVASVSIGKLRCRCMFQNTKRLTAKNSFVKFAEKHSFLTTSWRTILMFMIRPIGNHSNVRNVTNGR